MGLKQSFLNLIQADEPALKDPGPFLAKVVSHQDPEFMGSLQVELLKTTTSGNEPGKAGQTFHARYITFCWANTRLVNRKK